MIIVEEENYKGASIHVRSSFLLNVVLVILFVLLPII
jgi:hypothetical protein